ncbi:MAG: hypothetical protein FWB91_10530 [Defluviitaleaceae bacterium]|nr:hypothetical protein [Defluviitaleaceae bacterium]
MLAINATQARNEWSMVVDTVIREKPQFIKRTRDYMLLTDFSVLENLLSAYTFNAEALPEEDGTVTVTLDEIELAENGADQRAALKKLACAILEYSEDYYKDFTYWAKGSKVDHIPYIFKALMLNDVEKIGGQIKCRRGGI